MSTVQWAGRALLVAISTYIGVTTYIKAAVYSRAEGEKLEHKVEALEVNERQNIATMRDKVDEIYRLLIEQRSRRGE